jgi:hypothetical protein
MAADGGTDRDGDRHVVVEVKESREIGPAEAGELVRECVTLTHKRLDAALSRTFERLQGVDPEDREMPRAPGPDAAGAAALDDKIAIAVNGKRALFTSRFRATFDEALQRRRAGKTRPRTQRSGEVELAIVELDAHSAQVSLKTAVNAMQPTGGTNQAIGLALAWQSLLVGGPFNTPAEDANVTYNRVIILLSDGLNTEDRWPEYGNGSSQASGNPIDARQALMCSNLKAAKDSKGQNMYTIYTIQVNTGSPADPTSTVLQNCASSSDKFFMLTSSSQIVTTFNTIGTALSKLRLAK